MVNDIDLKQGTEEWRRARAGSLGAASIHDALAKGAKGQWLAGRKKIMDGLIAERLTGIPWDGYRTPAMQWGIEKEPEARELYAANTLSRVTEVGIVRHPTIAGAHASPDGLVGDHGLVEIKCPTTTTHIDTLTTGVAPEEYITQIQWQLACTGREWCDYVSYDPRVAPALQMYIQSVPRDRDHIRHLEVGVSEFLADMQAKLDALATIYGDISAPPYVDLMASGFEPVAP